MTTRRNTQAAEVWLLFALVAILVLLVVGTLLAQLYIHYLGPLNDALGGSR